MPSHKGFRDPPEMRLQAIKIIIMYVIFGCRVSTGMVSDTSPVRHQDGV